MSAVTANLSGQFIAGLILVLLLVSCMKKRCISCITDYPEVEKDTFHMKTRTHKYCDITVERGDYLERLGNKDTLLLLNGHVVPVRITTICD